MLFSKSHINAKIIIIIKDMEIEFQKKFKHYGEKSKTVSLHPSLNLFLTGQYNGRVLIFNYEKQTLVKSFDVSQKPLRHCSWISEQEFITCGDDMFVRIFDFQTEQKKVQFQAHEDFIRKVLFIPGTKEILVSSDDRTITHWRLVNNLYQKHRTLREHSHFVMDIKLSPY